MRNNNTVDKSEWKEVELGQVATYRRDKIESVLMNEENYISTENMLQDKKGIQTSSYVPTEGKVSKYQKGNILVSNIRPYFKKIWYATFDGGCSNDVIVFDAKENIVDSKFLYFQLSKDDFFDFMMAGANGTKMPRGNKDAIPTYKILLPPLPIQHRIAAILSAYDDLIENNLKRIKLLEEVAQRTYEEWFVKFRINGTPLPLDATTGLPVGWERKSLTSVAEFLNGFAFKPSDWFDFGLPIIKIKEMKNGIGNDTPRNEGGRIPNKYLIKKGDILFSWSASLEVIIWQGEDGWLNQHLFKVTPKEYYSREFVHQALLFCLEEFNNLTTGATMKHIKRQELDFVKIAISNGDILAKFENQINPIQNQILNLALQTRLLKESRDILLPKLMNGSLNVASV